MKSIEPASVPHSPPFFLFFFNQELQSGSDSCNNLSLLVPTNSTGFQVFEIFFFFFSFISENPSSAHLFWNRTKPASNRRRRPRGRARGLRRAPTRSHGAKTECVLRSFSGFTVRCLSSAVRNTRYVKPQGSRHQSWAQRALVWGSALARQMGLDLWLCSSEPGLYFKSQQ